MKHHAIATLEHLERIDSPNVAWRVYAMNRSAEVQQLIVKLRVFAARKPETHIAALVTIKADSLQSRLNAVLAK